MANLMDVIGALIQSEPTKSTNSRLQNALGAGEPASESVLENLFGGGGIDKALSGLFGGGQEGGGIGGMLSGVLNEASQAVGGKQNLALGGLGALAGSLFGGGSGSVKGALGGGVMAVLGAMALSALKGTQQETTEVPLGLRKPTSPVEAGQLENQAELIIKAMVNAAKADAQLDQGEIGRIVGKLEETGVDQQARNFVLSEMNKPMDTEEIIAAAKGNPQLAAELYAASLLAIEVDTPAERTYMQNLASGLGLEPQAVTKLESALGVK
jgi:uncharacterized membrane protein YebE (DUF533 family)